MAVEPMGPVVVGVDGSYSALRAVDLAAEEAVRAEAAVRPARGADPHDGVAGRPARRGRLDPARLAGPFPRGLVTHAMVDLDGCPVAAVPLP